MAEENLPQSTPVTNVPLPSTPKKSYTLPLVLIFAFFSIAVSGYLFWQNQQLMKQLAALQTTTAQPLTTSPSPLASLQPTTEAADPTAGWNTYENINYHFSFMYPPSSQIREYSDQLNRNLISLDQTMNFYVGDRRRQELNYIESEQNEKQPKELTVIKVNSKNYPVTKTIFGEGLPGDEKFANCSIYLTANTYYIDIESQVLLGINTKKESKCDANGVRQTTDNFDSNIQFVNQILATFKFTE